MKNGLLQKKKFIKKIVLAFLSIFIVGQSYITRVHALSNVITYNQYGSFERVNYKASLGNYGVSMAGLKGNLQGKYSGSLSINISLNGHSLSEYSVVPSNCWITYYDSSVINIQFNDVSEFEVLFTSTTLDASATITINSLTNWNMNMITYGDNFLQQHIYDSVDQLEGYVDNVENLLNTNNQLLQTIANNSTGNNTTIVNNIDTNVENIADELTLLKTSNDNILSNFISFLTDNSGNIITMDSVINKIDETTNAIIAVQNKLSTISTTLSNINTTLNNINNAVQNIDNTIDTISWKNVNINSYGILLNNSWNVINTSQVVSGTYQGMYITADINALQGSIFYIRLPFSRYDPIKLKIYYSKTENLSSVFDITDITYVIKGRYYTDLFIDTSRMPAVINGNKQYFVINNGNYYYQSQANNKLNYISQDDIEYWKLINYFTQYNYYQAQLNANNTIIDKLTELINKQTDIVIKEEDKTEVNNNINNYNNVMTDINEIEIDFKNEFNTSNNSIQTQNLTPSQNLQDSRIVLGGVFNTFLDEFAFLKTWLILLLICAIALILLGH